MTDLESFIRKDNVKCELSRVYRRRRRFATETRNGSEVRDHSEKIFLHAMTSSNYSVAFAIHRAPCIALASRCAIRNVIKRRIICARGSFSFLTIGDFTRFSRRSIARKNKTANRERVASVNCDTGNELRASNIRTS